MILRELHGGGTPTFLPPASNHWWGHIEKWNWRKNTSSVLRLTRIHQGAPENPSAIRVSAHQYRRSGFCPEILEIINRKQDFDDVHRVTRQARRLGYASINYDLIFGLPLQTKQHMVETIRKVKILLPRNASPSYSYAHVPWIKPSQRFIQRRTSRWARQELYDLGAGCCWKPDMSKSAWTTLSFHSDSFIRLWKLLRCNETLWGIRLYFTDLTIAWGFSISDCWNAFVQNEKA